LALGRKPVTPIVTQKRVVPLSGQSGISEQKKLVEKFEGIPAMQQQDFPRGKQAVVSEVEIKRRRCRFC